MTRNWRWAALAALLAVLVSLPALAHLLPTKDSDLTATQLRDLVRASDQVQWEGLGESRADLPLPDVPDLGNVPALLGGTTRTRTTWVAPDRWRIDQLDTAAEVDTIQERLDQLVDDASGFAVGPTDSVTTTWNSADRTVTSVFGEPPVRLPRAGDLSAPVLGRRLVNTPDVGLSRIGERRVAGRTGVGLRLTPDDPASTTVSSVDLWVDPDSGLALRVEVNAPGQRVPVLTSLLLDLDVGSADASRLAFDPPADAQFIDASSQDIATQINQFLPFLLPDDLAGERRNAVGLSGGGVGVYGTGLEAFTVVPVQGGLARRVLDAADQDNAFRTPLVNALVGVDGRRVYLLAGTVPLTTLQKGLDELKANRPPRLNS